jgi:hypothetical protein
MACISEDVNVGVLHYDDTAACASWQQAKADVREEGSMLI